MGVRKSTRGRRNSIGGKGKRMLLMLLRELEGGKEGEHLEGGGLLLLDRLLSLRYIQVRCMERR